MKNFLLRFLLPPAYATICFLPFTIGQANGLQDILGFGTIVLLFAYVFAGLPALAFAYAMGRIQRRGFRHNGVRLFTAGLLGLIAGALICIPFGLASGMIFPPLGCGVGLLVELTVIQLERRRRRSEARTERFAPLS